jgi:hypothetical protein
MMHYLDDTWSLYFHDPQQSDWTMSSYIKLCDLSTAEDFWAVDNLLGDNISKAMFFLMREHVFPCWDDKSNITGGCLSLKVLKSQLPNFWNTLASHLLTDHLLHDATKMSLVNGISTSPKKSFCIVKIWVSNHCLSDSSLWNLPMNYEGELLYKSSIDNISSEQQKK